MLLIYIAIVTVLAYYFNSYLRKYFELVVILTSIIAYVSMYYYNAFTSVFVEGTLGLAFFIVVMYAGVFPHHMKISKRLRGVRKELSIIGFIALIPHFVLYLIDYITGAYPWELYGVFAMVIMIPLFITSFQGVKKKLGMKKWVKIQKFAYLAYLLIFLHLYVVASPEHQVLYIVIFAIYTTLKVQYYLLLKHSVVKRLLMTSIIVLALALSSSIVYAEMNNDGFSIFNNLNDESTLTDNNPIAASSTDGTYRGTADGFHGDTVIVDVTFSDGLITNIDLIDCGCSDPHHGTDYEAAAQRIINSVLLSQTTDVDAVSGATTTSKGILAAIEEAIDNYNNA